MDRLLYVLADLKSHAVFMDAGKCDIQDDALRSGLPYAVPAVKLIHPEFPNWTPVSHIVRFPTLETKNFPPEQGTQRDQVKVHQECTNRTVSPHFPEPYLWPAMCEDLHPVNFACDYREFRPHLNQHPCGTLITDLVDELATGPTILLTPGKPNATFPVGNSELIVGTMLPPKSKVLRRTGVLFKLPHKYSKLTAAVANIYYCHPINRNQGILRAVLSFAEVRSLLKRLPVRYVGQQFPKAAQDQTSDFAIICILDEKLGQEWQPGFYCFDADIMGVEDAVLASTVERSSA